MRNKILSIIFQKIKNDILKGPWESLSLYWIAYGGRKELLDSLYLWIAIFLGILIALFGDNNWDWKSDVLTIIPSILGFTLGGYAILVGFGDTNFFNIICGKKGDEKASLYMRVNSSFLHFIIVQFLSIFYTIIMSALNTENFILKTIGIILFLYALLTIVSTSFSVLRLANWFDMSIENNKKKNINKDS